jgi:tyrosinase
MAIIAVSAYDPVFWLHHAMVDRIFALWQALYPGSYVEAQRQWVPTFWYNNGTVLDSNSGLLPFYSDPAGDFWTSESSRDVTSFGYTYDELELGNQADVRQAINSLYGPSNVQSGEKSNIKRSTTARTYRLIFQTPNGRLPNSYTVYFFLDNPVSEDPATWPLDTNLLGSQGVLQSIGSSETPLVVTGSAPLDSVLAKYTSSGRLASTLLSDVLHLVSGRMTWRVAMAGAEVSISLVPELKIGFSSRRYLPPQTANEFPVYLDADWEVHYSATKGQRGGMSGPHDV